METYATNITDFMIFYELSSTNIFTIKISQFKWDEGKNNDNDLKVNVLSMYYIPHTLLRYNIPILKGRCYFNLQSNFLISRISWVSEVKLKTLERSYRNKMNDSVFNVFPLNDNR